MRLFNVIIMCAMSKREGALVFSAHDLRRYLRLQLWREIYFMRLHFNNRQPRDTFVVVVAVDYSIIFASLFYFVVAPDVFMSICICESLTRER